MKRTPIAHAVLAALALVNIAAAAPGTAGEEQQIGADSRKSVSVTIYNDGQALVRDTRSLMLHTGENRIAFRDVASSIRSETTSIRRLAGPDFGVLEQNYEFDLLTPTALLNKYVGREVTVVHTNPGTGAETQEKATVLATNEGVVLRYANRIETGVSGRIIYDSVPSTLRDRPTLSLLLNSQAAGKEELELTYLANNMAWKADYIANINQAGNRMQLNGWVTLTNRSGTGYENAQLQLIAGTLNRVAPEAPRMVQRIAAAAPLKRAEEPMAEEKLGDYHLYTLDRPTTIANNQSKQVALLSAAEIPVSREYVLQSPGGYYWYQNALRGQQKGLKPSVFLRFDNKGGDLGLPLPAGVIRVYTKDSHGGAQFIGEDSIQHTAKGETLNLRLGEAFDVTADRTQTDYKVLSKTSSQSSYHIEIRNADSKPVTVTVREPLQGDWEIVNENSAHIKESAGSAVWKINVPAEGKAVLDYTVNVRW